jgi:hypothetical protein
MNGITGRGGRKPCCATVKTEKRNWR